MKPTKLRGLILNATDFAPSIKFYEDTWGLKRVDSWRGDGVFFRGTGSEQFILGLIPGKKRGIYSIRLAMDSVADIDSAYLALREKRVNLIDEPGELPVPGNYYGFHFEDLDGTKVELSADVQSTEVDDEGQFLPERLSHVVLNSPDNVLLKNFYVNQLGFELADWYAGDAFFFLRCNEQHHSLGVEKGDNSSLNHVAFHVADLDAMMRCVGRMKVNGFEPLWGPGRHGPGGNCFCYFEDPNGYVIEFTSELIQIKEDENWVAKEWTLGPANANVWGTGGRTEQAIKRMAGH